VDLVCYRKHGHNELDDPTFTQPVMYAKIAAHKPASQAYAERLVGETVIDDSALKGIEQSIEQRLNQAHARAHASERGNGDSAPGGLWEGLEWAGDDWSADTRVSEGTLRGIAEAAARLPGTFRPHPRVARLLESRIEMLSKGTIDWGCAETLAIGSVLLEGHRVRLSGQDTGRGTFSHRHAILSDVKTGDRYVPLQHLAPDQASLEVFDTPLSEAAALGFEYGYSTADPHPLVIWEAQFGDFANVAQVYIDQFLASAESKWRRMSGLTLLLPHGYEGQGPEHSSARLERFLELCADGNLQVCNLTTPAQFFHALRRQVHRSFRKPLVIMSPKSLLRHKLATSAIEDLSQGTFHPTLDDTAIDDAESVSRVLLVSGKFHYTLIEAREQLAAELRGRVAIVRIEQLYPFPDAELGAILSRYSEVRELVWVQEEPENMGAWRQIRHRLEAVKPERVSLIAVARPAAPTPASGYYPMHVAQERSLLEQSFANLAPIAAESGVSPARSPGARAHDPRRPGGGRPGATRSS